MKNTNYLAHGPQETPDLTPGTTHSIDVVIDLDGFRKSFRIGWRDITSIDDAHLGWRFHDDEAYEQVDIEGMKWMDILPHAE